MHYTLYYLYNAHLISRSIIRQIMRYGTRQKERKERHLFGIEVTEQEKTDTPT